MVNVQLLCIHACMYVIVHVCLFVSIVYVVLQIPHPCMALLSGTVNVFDPLCAFCNTQHAKEGLVHPMDSYIYIFVMHIIVHLYSIFVHKVYMFETT